MLKICWMKTEGVWDPRIPILSNSFSLYLNPQYRLSDSNLDSSGGLTRARSIQFFTFSWAFGSVCRIICCLVFSIMAFRMSCFSGDLGLRRVETCCWVQPICSAIYS